MLLVVFKSKGVWVHLAWQFHLLVVLYQLFTKAAQMEQGGSVSETVGNDGYVKTAVSTITLVKTIMDGLHHSS
jgi:hypothetical protein